MSPGWSKQELRKRVRLFGTIAAMAQLGSIFAATRALRTSPRRQRLVAMDLRCDNHTDWRLLSTVDCCNKSGEVCDTRAADLASLPAPLSAMDLQCGSRTLTAVQQPGTPALFKRCLSSSQETAKRLCSTWRHSWCFLLVLPALGLKPHASYD